MAIPTSGLFTSAQVRTEFGLGTSFTSAQVAAAAGIAAAHHSDTLRGKSGADLVPNAVNWTNIYNMSGQFGSNDRATNVQTILGITQPISLRVELTSGYAYGSYSSGSGQTGFSVYIYNGDYSGSYGQFDGGFGGGNFTGVQNFSISNGQSILFHAYVTATDQLEGQASGQGGCLLTVKNMSDGGTVLDTLQIDLGTG